jgi:hypothetical protein
MPIFRKILGCRLLPVLGDVGRRGIVCVSSTVVEPLQIKLKLEKHAPRQGITAKTGIEG